MNLEIRKRMQMADYPNRHWRSLANSLINSIRVCAREFPGNFTGKLKNLTKYFSAFHGNQPAEISGEHCWKFTLAEGGMAERTVTRWRKKPTHPPTPPSLGRRVKSEISRHPSTRQGKVFARANGNAESFAVTRGSFVSVAQIVNHGQLLNVICNLTTTQRLSLPLVLHHSHASQLNVPSNSQYRTWNYLITSTILIHVAVDINVRTNYYKRQVLSHNFGILHRVHADDLLGRTSIKNFDSREFCLVFK